MLAATRATAGAVAATPATTTAAAAATPATTTAAAAAATTAIGLGARVSTLLRSAAAVPLPALRWQACSHRRADGVAGAARATGATVTARAQGKPQGLTCCGLIYGIMWQSL